MQNTQNSNIIYYICIAIIIFFWGCSVEQTHKTLTFFFDGVNELNVFNSYLSKDSINKDAIAKREDVLKRNRPDLFVHIPYKEKKCEKCHTPDKHLRMPLPGLCYQCHKNFTETYAYVHGPVASGNCTKCHNQHVSSYPKLLARAGQQVCTYCHNTTMVFRNRFHRDIEDAECTMCHNPHGGNNRFMIKESIAKNFKGLGLTDEFDPRHFTAQIFSKVPGDVGYGKDIYILNDDGEIVSTTLTDNEGKFTLLNLHPNLNYTFKFKNETPCCKVNIIDANNKVVYVIDRNKKGKYVFDKTAYETVHKSIPKPEHQTDITHVSSLKDTTNQGSILTSDATKNQENPGVNDSKDIAVNNTDTANSGKIIVKPIPDSVSTEEILTGKIYTDTGSSEATNKNSAGAISSKGKIVVKTIPDNVSTEEVLGLNKTIDTTNSKQVTTNNDAIISKNKIVVKEIPDSVSTEEVLRAGRGADTTGKASSTTGNINIPGTGGYKGKIVVRNMPDIDSASADEIINNEHNAIKNSSDTSREIKVGGKSLAKLAEQITPYYSGFVVWVLDDAGRLLGTGKVDTKGDFLLNDNLPYYHIKLPPKDKNVVSQIIYLNEDMELIEIVGKKNVNGHTAYTHTANKFGNYVYKVKNDNDENLELISTIYFDRGKSTISARDKTELNKVAAYLITNRAFRVDVIGYSDSKGAAAYNNVLAEDRVNAVINYLVLKGVNSRRITGKGIGKPSQSDAGEQGGENTKDRKVNIYVR